MITTIVVDKLIKYSSQRFILMWMQHRNSVETIEGSVEKPRSKVESKFTVAKSCPCNSLNSLSSHKLNNSEKISHELDAVLKSRRNS